MFAEPVLATILQPGGLRRAMHSGRAGDGWGVAQKLWDESLVWYAFGACLVVPSLWPSL